MNNRPSVLARQSRISCRLSASVWRMSSNWCCTRPLEAMIDSAALVMMAGSVDVDALSSRLNGAHALGVLLDARANRFGRGVQALQHVGGKLMRASPAGWLLAALATGRPRSHHPTAPPRNAASSDRPNCTMTSADMHDPVCGE